MRLAFLSDPHLPPPVAPTRRQLASKRALGWANWTRGRHLVHRRETLDALTDDVAASAVDLTVVGGDLTNLALDAEVRAARDWLESLGGPDRVLAIPGNHDAYVPGALDHALKVWGDYARGASGEAYPVLRTAGAVRVIGLSSAVPSAPFMATGRIGAEQARALDRLLDAGEGPAIVAVHHPLGAASHRFERRLVDSRAVTALLRGRVRLVLHGHLHAPLFETLSDGTPMIGVPSASAALGRAHHPAGWLLVEVGAREIVTQRRTMVGPGRFETTETRRFTLA